MRAGQVLIEPGAPPATGGFSYPEAMTSLLLVAMLVQVSWGVASTQRAAAHLLEDRIELLGARQMVRWILQEEVRAGLPGRDWQTPADDSLALRAFRGWALVSAREGGTSAEDLVVCRWGLRGVDPGKDSVLVLSAGGHWTAARLVSSEASVGECSGGARFLRERWRIDPVVPDAILARVFERGVYFIRDSALRYRRGQGGRQPLTPPRILLRGGRLRTLHDGGMAWELESTSLDGRKELLGWMGSARSLEGAGRLPGSSETGR